MPLLGPGSRLTLAGTVQYDDIRDVQGIASVNLRIPFGRGGVASGARLSPMERRMLSPIRRDDDILTVSGLGAEEVAEIVGNGKDGVTAENVTVINDEVADADVANVVAADTSGIVVIDRDVTTATPIVLNADQMIGGQFKVRGKGHRRQGDLRSATDHHGHRGNVIEIAKDRP